MAPGSAAGEYAIRNRQATDIGSRGDAHCRAPGRIQATNGVIILAQYLPGCLIDKQTTHGQ